MRSLSLGFLLVVLLACHPLAQGTEPVATPSITPHNSQPTPSLAAPGQNNLPPPASSTPALGTKASTLELTAVPPLVPLASATPNPDLQATSGSKFADVISVSATGNPGNYQFSVTMESPDTGCDQYADWWEVLSTQGSLLYRRVLLHSHVGEQPFTRSGGPVKVEADQTVLVRAHMSTGGYGGIAFTGSPTLGFQPVSLETTFAMQVEQEPPLPSNCAF